MALQVLVAAALCASSGSQAGPGADWAGAVHGPLLWVLCSALLVGNAGPACGCGTIVQWQCRRLSSRVSSIEKQAYTPDVVLTTNGLNGFQIKPPCHAGPYTYDTGLQRRKHADCCRDKTGTTAAPCCSCHQARF
jgi:hypothetical protein